jgi:hypothetical protein
VSSEVHRKYSITPWAAQDAMTDSRAWNVDVKKARISLNIEEPCLTLKERIVWHSIPYVLLVNDLHSKSPLFCSHSSNLADDN